MLRRFDDIVEESFLLPHTVDGTLKQKGLGSRNPHVAIPRGSLPEYQDKRGVTRLMKYKQNMCVSAVL